jgi:hypothetical protein
MSTTNLSSLLGDAGLGASATAALQLTVDTLGPAIQAGLGTIDIDNITTSEVVLVTLLIDDSSSIRFVSGNTEAVRVGHNAVIDALQGSKQSASVLIGCRMLNSGALYPYVTLDNATRLDGTNYNPSGNTPLYDETIVTLASVTAKMAEFEQGGVAVRAITVIVTDGEDNMSWKTPATVKQIVDGLLFTEQHIVAGVGIKDGRTDFDAVFAEMGILPNWILKPDNTPSEIRAAFATISQSAVRASQAAGSFSQVAIGGFGS